MLEPPKTAAQASARSDLERGLEQSDQILEAKGHLVVFDPLGSRTDPFQELKSLLQEQEESQELQVRATPLAEVQLVLS